jgi:hypothetical protein
MSIGITSKVVNMAMQKLRGLREAYSIVYVDFSNINALEEILKGDSLKSAKPDFIHLIDVQGIIENDFQNLADKVWDISKARLNKHDSIQGFTPGRFDISGVLILINAVEYLSGHENGEFFQKIAHLYTENQYNIILVESEPLEDRILDILLYLNRNLEETMPVKIPPCNISAYYLHALQKRGYIEC